MLGSLAGETTHYWQIVARNSAGTATGPVWSFTTGPVPGSLFVTLTPWQAIAGGAKWRVDGGAWQNNGATVGGLVPGEHVVDCAAVSGWITPVPESVQIDAGFTTSLARTYWPRGDVNCDGAANFNDINPFVMALVGRSGYEARYPDCRWLHADVNGDGYVDFGDINPFVACLASGCP